MHVTFFPHSSWRKIVEDVTTPSVAHLEGLGRGGESPGYDAIRIDKAVWYSTIGYIGRIGNI
jgi:hypothetical protein